MIHSLPDVFQHILDAADDIPAVFIQGDDSFAAFCKAGEYRTVDFRFAILISVTEQKRAVCQLAVLRKEAHRGQRFFGQGVFPFVSILAEGKEILEIFRAIILICRKHIILNRFTAAAHFNNLFVCCSVRKSLSAHVNGWYAIILNNNRLVGGFCHINFENEQFFLIHLIPEK